MSCGPPAKENGCYNINVLRVLEHSLAGGLLYFLTSHSSALIFKYGQVLPLQPTDLHLSISFLTGDWKQPPFFLALIPFVLI